MHLFSFIVDCLEALRGRILELGSLTGLASCTLLSQMDEILMYLAAIPNVKITDQQQTDIIRELDRLFALANLLEMKSHPNIRNGIVLNANELNREFERIENEILCLNRFDKERSEVVNAMLAQVEKKVGEVIDLKKMIRLALSTTEGSNQQGHWYKCRNGHYYYVGNCGQFNASSRCPDCKEVVGSGSTRILAPEMLQ